ncbi:hypothetical protein L0636_01180 [Halomonas janggokensis]|uniref:Uncharacterized protein n=1 Tax=Vreelandella janggokensis TaxID=370767 RepID=A0ABT4IS49_9GAMM|nr:hypothetical protein [Halomonas janggokensis]MCZ0926501.1 hypothetical protein [Halomonas janggokensis]MCZ0929039.1 hypothetical protein [Halomonas janggokensis]
MKSVLFKSEMTAAILAENPDYQKTMTRRPLRPQIPSGWEMGTSKAPGMTLGAITSPHPKKGRFGLFIRREIHPGSGKFEHDIIAFPYGRPGEVIYVKETYWAWGRWETRFDEKKGRDAWHFVDMTRECGKEYQFSQPVPMGTRAGVQPAWHKRPSLFMPAHASRILLEVLDAHVERLRDISEADAKAEGAKIMAPHFDSFVSKGRWTEHKSNFSYRNGFQYLWQSINGPGSWEENPLVWVITFKRLEDTDERYQRIAS